MNLYKVTHKKYNETIELNIAARDIETSIALTRKHIDGLAWKGASKETSRQIVKLEFVCELHQVQK